MNKEKLKREVEEIIKQIIEDDILGQFEGLDCYYDEDNELSKKEIEYIQSLKVCELILME